MSFPSDHPAPAYDGEEYFETLSAGGTADMTEEERAAFHLRHDGHWL